MSKTLVIIPCYNEENRLNSQVFLDYAKEHQDIYFLFVNDGSKDGTKDIINAIATKSTQCKCLHLSNNSGKAEAVRRGMLAALENGNDYQYIGFFDADLATPLYEIQNFMKEMEKSHFDIVSGLRLSRLGADVQRKKSRHYIGRCFATTASLVLHIPIYDTQCGAKFFKKEIVETLFADKFCSKWIFDVEIFARYLSYIKKENTRVQICEMPLSSWKDIGGSRLKFRDFFVAPFELIRIKRKYL